MKEQNRAVRICQNPTSTTIDSKKMSAKQATFLYAAITDTQGTIRAIDSKTNYLAVLLAIPTLKLGAIYGKIAMLMKGDWTNGKWLVLGLVVPFVASWFLAVLAAFRALCAIDNPSSHITGNLPVAAFYLPTLFRPALIDVFTNRDIKAERQLHQHREEIPATDDAIVDALSFEQMKLVYIRSVKTLRSQWAYRFAAAWALLGGMLWLRWLSLF